MNTFRVSLLMLSLAALLSLSAIAAEKPEKKAGKKQSGPVAALEKKIAALDLSAEQKLKVDEILEQHKKKFAELEAKAKAGELTDEQKKAQKEALAKAKADGKKNKEVKAEVEAAVKLTDEQRKAQRDHATALKEAQAALKKSLAAALNPEQVEKLGLGEKKKKKDG